MWRWKDAPTCRQIKKKKPLKIFKKQPWISEVKQNSVLAKGLLLVQTAKADGDVAYGITKKTLRFAQQQSRSCTSSNKGHCRVIVEHLQEKSRVDSGYLFWAGHRGANLVEARTDETWKPEGVCGTEIRDVLSTGGGMKAARRLSCSGRWLHEEFLGSSGGVPAGSAHAGRGSPTELAEGTVSAVSLFP